MNPSARTRAGLVEIVAPGAGAIAGHAAASAQFPGERGRRRAHAGRAAADRAGRAGRLRRHRGRRHRDRRRRRHRGPPRPRPGRGPTASGTARCGGSMMQLAAERPRRSRAGSSSTRPAARRGARPRRRGARLRLAARRSGRRRRPVWPSTRSPSTRRPACANGLVTVEVDPDDGTFSIDGLRRVRPPRRRRRRRRHLQLLPAGGDRDRRPARLGRRSTWSRRGRCGPGCRSCPPTAGPSASWTSARVGERGGRGDAPRSSSTPANGLVRVTTSSSTTPVATTGCGSWFPLPEPATSSRAECAFADGRPGPRRPRAAPPSGPGHLPVPALRAGRRAHRRPRGPARVRAGRRPATGRRRAAPTALALTLLRCTGMLSQGPMATGRCRPAR